MTRTFPQIRRLYQNRTTDKAEKEKVYHLHFKTGSHCVPVFFVHTRSMNKSVLFFHFLLFPLFAVPVWAAGGTYKPWQDWFIPMCILVWIGYMILPASIELNSRKTRLQSLIKDPAWWCSLGFITFLLIQTFNSGREMVLDPELNQWIYSPPPFPSLPSSVNQEWSMEMVRWFAPTLTALLLIKHNWKIFSMRTFLTLICINGFFNAILAFIHVGFDWVLMYNFQKFGRDVYGSFGYPNHGALYFILMFTIALGMLLHELFSERSQQEPWVLFLSGVCSPVFFVAANLSTSRAGILGSWLVLILGLLTILVISFPRIHPVQRMYISMGALMAAALLFVSLSVFMKDIHIRELRNATVNLDVVKEINARFWQVENAWEIWKDHPFVGVGGWGYKYFAGMYLPQEEWHLLGSKGKANVHHDFMQYLAEFGIIGMGLLTIALTSTIFTACKHLFTSPGNDQSLWASPLRFTAFWGLGILIADSMIDIPFRSPAVMIHGLLLLLMMIPTPDYPGIWAPLVDWKRLTPPPNTLLKQTQKRHSGRNSSKNRSSRHEKTDFSLNE